MSDTERIEKLRKLLSPTIEWYRGQMLEHDHDSSYLYDMTIEVLADNMSRSDAQELIEILISESKEV